MQVCHPLAAHPGHLASKPLQALATAVLCWGWVELVAPLICSWVLRAKTYIDQDDVCNIDCSGFGRSAESLLSVVGTRHSLFLWQDMDRSAWHHPKPVARPGTRVTAASDAGSLSSCSCYFCCCAVTARWCFVMFACNTGAGWLADLFGK
jgi:hypothetical protein